MIDRIFAFGLMIVALVYGLIGFRVEVPFAYDPLGPRPVPLILSAVLMAASIIILMRPRGYSSPEPVMRRRFLYLMAIMLFYHATWSFLGFLLSTTISCYMVSRLFNCTWMQGLMTALVLSVTCYGLFNFLLLIPLPLGMIFRYTGN